MKRLAFLLLLVTTSCHHTARVAPTTKTRQDQIAGRDLGWIYDTIPVMRFPVPAEYGTLRLQVESCVGRTKNGWPRFYISPVSPFGDSYMAAYFKDADAIVFGLGYEANPYIVRHELIHWLVSPQNGHPAEFYGPDSRCKALITQPGS